MSVSPYTVSGELSEQALDDAAAQLQLAREHRDDREAAERAAVAS